MVRTFQAPSTGLHSHVSCCGFIDPSGLFVIPPNITTTWRVSSNARA
jgi:hypothetical protein